MSLNSLRLIGPIASSVALILSTQHGAYLNDSKKRDFYEDDNEVTPKPGTIVPASSSDLQSLGPNNIVNGVTVRSPSALQSGIKSLRLKSHELYEALAKQYDQITLKYYDTEREVTSTISSLHERKEDLLPNSIYVLVGALAGSVVTRRKNIVFRALAPVIFGLVSFKIFLPQTFENTRIFAWNVEKRKLPQLSEQQVLALGKAQELANDVELGYKTIKEKADSSLESTSKLIAEYTALNTDRDVTKKSK